MPVGPGWLFQAEKLEENFRKNAEKYYTQIMELLSRDEKV